MLMKSFLNSSALLVKILIVSGLLALTSCSDTTLDEMKQDNALRSTPAAIIGTAPTTAPSNDQSQINRINTFGGSIQLDNSGGDNDYLLRGNPPKPSFKETGIGG